MDNTRRIIGSEDQPGHDGPSGYPPGRRTPGEFFRAYRAPLRRFFLRRVDARADVDDLVQEVFCRIVALGKHERFENPDAYIFQVAANLVRDRARRAKTRQAFSQRLTVETEHRFEEISPERVLQGKEAVTRLQAALEELPQRTRAVFLLHRFEGFKYREIAKRLGISPSSVEKHMMAAIKHVFERMGKSDDKN